MTETLPIDSIQVGTRHRSLSQETVAVLANSMKEIGLQTPITVWAQDNDAPLLVTGLHRLEAGKRLDWESIPVSFVVMNEMERELWEISENLHRADLTTEERYSHIRRYAELVEARRQAGDRQGVQSTAPVEPHGHKQDRSVDAQTADELGISHETVQRARDESPRPPQKELSPEEIDNKDFERIVKAWNQSGKGGKELFRDFLV